MKTVDSLNICAPSSPNRWNSELVSVICVSYTPRFLVEVHCTFARSFSEHPNCLSLRTLICNTFVEGHPNSLQIIFLCCWNDLQWNLYYADTLGECCSVTGFPPNTGFNRQRHMRCQMPFKWTVETFRKLPETMTIYVCINFFIKVDQLIIVP